MCKITKFIVIHTAFNIILGLYFNNFVIKNKLHVHRLFGKLRFNFHELLIEKKIVITNTYYNDINLF